MNVLFSISSLTVKYDQGSRLWSVYTIENANLAVELTARHANFKIQNKIFYWFFGWQEVVLTVILGYFNMKE